MEPKRTLGNTGLDVSTLGMGLMQWGDIKFQKQDPSVKNSEVIMMFKTALDAGVTFFDTAEMYGRGVSELHLRGCLETTMTDIVIATKFMPFPWRLSKGELRIALRKSLRRIGVDHVDLYQMHWPFPPISIPTWMEAMSDAVDDGLIRAVGVSNYSAEQTQLAFDSLAKHNIPLASNQVKYNILDRRPDRSGLVDLCKQLGVTIIAYSPLERGILTGKYNQDNLPRRFLSWRYNKAFLVKIEPLFDVLREVGKDHGGKTLAMVSLNWLMCKGAVPIPGARNQLQVTENVGALGWQLSEDEINRLDEMSRQIIF